MVLKEHANQSVNLMVYSQMLTYKLEKQMAHNVLPLSSSIKEAHIRKVVGNEVYNRVELFLKEKGGFLVGVHLSAMEKNFQTEDQVKQLKNAFIKFGRFDTETKNEVSRQLDVYIEKLQLRSKINDTIFEAQEVRKSIAEVVVTKEVDDEVLISEQNCSSVAKILGNGTNITKHIFETKKIISVQEEAVTAEHNVLNSILYNLYKAKDYVFGTKDADKYDVDLIKQKAHEVKAEVVKIDGGVEAFDKKFNANMSLLATESLAKCKLKGLHDYFTQENTKYSADLFVAAYNNCDKAYGNNGYIIPEVAQAVEGMMVSYTQNQIASLDINDYVNGSDGSVNGATFIEDVLHQLPSPVHTAEV
ncbi:hypothetical protein RFI_38614 [Reticulomyxa filosa]|uniref:Uncharacterized protein n=1 Tax=Reticulomyxa filosa TaxID=46433 RepID=X6LBJ0_RETFI|nr:hypothetical protein RFI_38614 [Reticulomyxa filosa]|eukprot:ETN98873.1 hypothetical protein RFI_38614 [Reticulomyxa filosa]